MFHIQRSTKYEGVAAFDDIRTAAHIVPDRYLAAAPDDFFKHHTEKQKSVLHYRVHVRLYRLPSRPVRPQEVSGSLVPAPSPEGVGIVSL